MTITQTASERITAEVTGWPGIAAGTGSRGEFSFKLGRREIGHLHGDHSAHFGFPKEVAVELKRGAASARTRPSRTRSPGVRGGSRARTTCGT